MWLGDRYLLREELGRGAWATVYRAHQASTSREVAVKLLRREACLTEEVVRRTLREARLASGLEHPNIVAVHDHGSFEGQPFIVMEWVRGGTLASLLGAARRLEVSRALPVFAHVARGLAHAHRSGVVHRDVKPENILTRVGMCGAIDAKLADFGVATAPATDGTLGAGGIGTPSYMAPEQALGRPVDGRADLYALGVVMFRTLTGRLPFEAPHAVAMALSHVCAPVPTFAEVAPDLGPMEALEGVVRRLLEKEPDDRHPSAEALLRDLDSISPAEVSASAASFAGLGLRIT